MEMGQGSLEGDEAEPAFEVRGLKKRYADVVAVDGLDLAARRGTCLGVLGPNGAGKTTTIEMLEGLKEPDEGEVRVLGLTWKKDGRRIRERIGVQLQETVFEDKLTVVEMLRLFRSFYRGGYTIEEVLALVGLEEKAQALVTKLSGGQKQRLALGIAILNRPEVLFLDEPTTGLDPQARRRVWEIVEAFKADGGTVLLTTHYMEEAERLADELVIVDRGRIIASGAPSAIVASLGAEAVVELVTRSGGPTLNEEELAELTSVRDVRREGERFVLSVTAVQASISALFELVGRQGIELEDLRTHRPTLEDVFVHLTGKHLRDE